MTQSTEILIVDDSRDLAELYKAFLEFEGYQARCAHSGAQALAVLAGGYRPNLLFVDCAMQGMSGTEFLRQASQAHPNLGTTTRIIGLTSFDATAPQLLEFRPLVHECWEKFGDADELVNAVKRLLEGLPAKGT